MQGISNHLGCTLTIATVKEHHNKTKIETGTSGQKGY